MAIERSSGILLHISSLPNQYGIGTFGKDAFQFVDFLKRSGQKYWQILPLNPPAEGNSPYSSYSAFALNPLLIDLDLLAADCLLNKADYQSMDFGQDSTNIDFDKVIENKFNLFRRAFEKSKGKNLKGFQAFVDKNQDWLFHYAEFMSFRNYFSKTLQEWDIDIKSKDRQAMERYYSLFVQEEVDFWIFLQYISNQQWINLKKYANANNIRIFGDLPLYVSADSADVWANPEIFDVDDDLNPVNVGGCPPDDYAKDGQRWGMPVYDWNYLEQTQFNWWIKRLERNTELYDVIRMDHFRGFESYYSISAHEQTARNGIWVPAKGHAFFERLKQYFGEIDIVLEDLGFITNEVIALKMETGYPGMKVFQFAFLTDESNPHLPHHCEKNSVVYLSTHDNDTVLGWLSHIGSEERSFLQSYLNTYGEEDIVWKCIEKVMSTESQLSIIPMQDFLELGSEARMNIPGTVNGNWKWRVMSDNLSSWLAKKINEIAKKYNR